jgi:hypothetical protein
VHNITWSEAEDQKPGGSTMADNGDDNSLFHSDELILDGNVRYLPDTTELADGRLLLVRVTSELAPNNAQHYKVVAQIYEPDGTPSGDEFVVAEGFEETPSLQDGFEIGNASAIGLADGGFAIVWRSEDQFPSDESEWSSDFSNVIRYKVFEADGTERTGEREMILPQDSQTAFNVQLTQFGDGFLASWTDRSDEPGNVFSQGVQVRAFDSEGDPVTHGTLDDPEYINGVRDGHQNFSALATLTNGRVVIVYQDQGAEGGTDVRAVILDDSGNPLIEDFVATQDSVGSQWVPQVAALADGRFAIMYRAETSDDEDALTVQMYKIEGSGPSAEVVFDGAPIEIAVTDESIESFDGLQIVGTAGSGFFASWVETEPYEEGEVLNHSTLYGQFFGADGVATGDKIEIAEGDMDLGYVSSAMESNHGGIVVTWQEWISNDGGVSYTGKYLTRFLKSPVEAGEEPIEGTNKGEKIFGTDGDDTILGFGGNDRIEAGAGDDDITGGRGADKLFGGAGSDTFIFETGDSGRKSAKADTIFDFSSEDRIDLTGWDANSKLADHQTFSFIGGQNFHGNAGELRAIKGRSDTWIEGDTNGDRKADFLIRLDDAVKLSAEHFDL